MIAPDCDVFVVDDTWDRFGEVVDLCYDVLYRDYGIARDTDWLDAASRGEFVVAIAEDGPVVGVARLMPKPGEESRQLRQVAVRPSLQGRGLGRLLVAELERLAASEGASSVWLNSRCTAYGFYKALGYRPIDPEFVSALTGIPHKLMRKELR